MHSTRSHFPYSCWIDVIADVAVNGHPHPECPMEPRAKVLLSDYCISSRSCGVQYKTLRCSPSPATLRSEDSEEMGSLARVWRQVRVKGFRHQDARNDEAYRREGPGRKHEESARAVRIDDAWGWRHRGGRRVRSNRGGGTLQGWVGPSTPLSAPPLALLTLDWEIF